MKLLTLGLLLLGCSGPAFTEQELNEQGNDTSAIGGGSGEVQNAGTGGLRTIPGYPEAGKAGSSGEGSGGLAGSAPSESGSGGQAMAGRPSMGEGGTSGEAMGGSPGASLSECLSNFQTLACAKVCTNAQACDENGNCQDCQAALYCYASHNSLDNCTAFTSMGISLAQSAVRNCCHD